MVVRHAGDAGYPHALSVWNFEREAKADHIYKLLMTRLDVGLATKLRQVGKPNGFELWRLLSKKLDPRRDNQNFHLESAVRDIAAHLGLTSPRR